ncbi:MAG: hypothetical protein WBW48_24385 [Anaerolineae bacterium]
MRESVNQRISESANTEPSATEQILDLLLEALLERQAVRQAQEEPGLDQVTPPSPAPQPTVEPSAPEPIAAAKPTGDPWAGEEDWVPPPPLPSINLGRTLGRLLLVLVVLVVVINVPITRYGTSLARIMPDTAALVIRDGLVLKGSGSDIFVLEDNKLRWISSLDAFEFFGYRWDQVHVVDDSFLEKFEKGRPIHVLLKCEGSPHIYALEDGQKRWIKDILTFEAEGYVWEDVKFVSCDYLHNLPDGPPIPEDAGPPPQPGW